MTDRIKSLIAIYLAITACCLIITSMKEDNFKSAALRADLRVAVMEIKGHSKTITAIRQIRNDNRQRGEDMERAAMLLAIAFAVASPALIAGVAGAWFLIGISWLASGSAAYFAWMAIV